MRLLACSFVLAIVACTRMPDRGEGPEAALIAARIGLERRDLGAHFDALTENAAREIAANSIGRCLNKNSAALQGMGYKPSVGCEAILSRYEWSPDGWQSPERFRVALAQIKNPRALAEELESNHRKHGAGTSFVWEYLDRVQVSNVVVNGSSARGVADWGDGERKAIAFEKDQTGWRVDPMPWAR